MVASTVLLLAGCSSNAGSDGGAVSPGQDSGAAAYDSGAPDSQGHEASVVDASADAPAEASGEGGGLPVDAGPCADPLLEGTECASDDAGTSYCNNGTCGPWTVGKHNTPPPIPLLSSGGTNSSVQLYVITYDSDPLRQEIEDYTGWIGTSDWISVLTQYGFTSIDFVENVQLHKPPPVDDPNFPGVAYGPDTMSAYAQSLIDDFILPPAADNVLYAFFMPYQPQSFYDPYSSGLCISEYAYHLHDTEADGGVSPLHAIVGTECDHLNGILGSSAASMETNFSHELAEWFTDPDDVGYRFPPTALGWSAGPEVADMCSFTQFGYTDPVHGYQMVPIWSNAAIAAGEPPCQPWPSSPPYLSVDSPSDAFQMVTPGQNLSIKLTGWASAPYGAWPIFAIDQFGVADFVANPELSAEIITNGGEVTMTVSIPSNATSGQQDSIWIESLTADNQYVGGWLVGLQVQ
jgi:hypothetical protein